MCVIACARSLPHRHIRNWSFKTSHLWLAAAVHRRSSEKLAFLITSTFLHVQAASQSPHHHLPIAASIPSSPLQTTHRTAGWRSSSNQDGSPRWNQRRAGRFFGLAFRGPILASSWSPDASGSQHSRSHYQPKDGQAHHQVRPLRRWSVSIRRDGLQGSDSWLLRTSQAVAWIV